MSTKPPPTIHSPPIDLTQPLDPTALKDLTILITGGASGLGAAFARHWSAHGANIIIGDINHAAGESLIAELRGSSPSPHHHFLSLDVTSWSSQVSFFAAAAQLSPHGGIDCVVANAGVNVAKESFLFENPLITATSEKTKNAPTHPIVLSTTPPPFQTLEVNLTSVLWTTHLAHAYLPLNPGSTPCSPSPSFPDIQIRDRHLLLIGSLAGLCPLPTQSLYSISKHAITGLFRNLRMTSPLRQGIRVNLLCPYFTSTPMLGLVGKAFLAGGAMAEMESVVEAATRLVADRGIVGRGLAVVPGAGEELVREAGMQELLASGGGGKGVEMGGAQRRGVWEVYAHDFEQSDLVARRMLGITNLIAKGRGWAGWFRDVGGVLWSATVGRYWL